MSENKDDQTSGLGCNGVVIVRRPELCGRSNEDLECLGCGHKLGWIEHRRRNGEPEYCPGEIRETVAR